MEFEFDDAKNQWNICKRGLSFTEVESFDFATAIRVEDERKDYGETRIVAYGFIGIRLHVLCYKPISDNCIRVISFRKANPRERKFYDKTIKTADR